MFYSTILRLAVTTEKIRLGKSVLDKGEDFLECIFLCYQNQIKHRDICVATAFILVTFASVQKMKFDQIGDKNICLF